ncbi:SRPBCC domain-containing protein [Paenibacillus athensensis]|uniref:ATPase n=1 Tax=Paenibacillus athensensis TaxID=1967502 RepID=A0A4Y8PTB2_9BACL|nr:SRPBCC domain-containing protein [Paenibacillus athensensis]MCD1257997.1 SRPBCC domain-containing protein [Paenibacillus athensensis]
MSTMKIRTEGPVLLLERVMDAPPELVFQMFKDAEHLKMWWGPRGWELSFCTVDFRPGGVWHYCMTCMDKNQGDFFGMESWGKAVYGDINEPKQFNYIDYFSDAEGNISPDLPPSKITMIFEEFEGKTRLHSRSEFNSAEDLQKVIEMGMEQGITETWDRLSEYLASQQ